jgi:23S rRNA (cytidine1920-2'-O)/16S rRNA (cytidine1409-2'-O)-methyltransferase
LRSDPRVVVMDRFNIRNLRPRDIPDPVDLAVIDVSFISLRLVLPVILPVLREQAHLVALVKPQFEVGKGQVGKGGIVRDEILRERVRDRFVEFARSLQLDIIGVMDSTLMGKKGNKELLVCLKKNGRKCAGIHESNARIIPVT